MVNVSINNVKFAVVLFIIDLVWLIGNKNNHKKQFESVQKSELRLDPVAGLLFYLVASVGYSEFIEKNTTSRQEAFKRGLLFGFLLYSSFDVTCKAVFVDYKWSYAVSDILWGSFAFGLASAIVKN